MDLLLVELGGGGDLVKSGNDLKVIYGWENFPYLALFAHRGGVTKSSYANNEFRTDFWMNNLFHPQEPAAQINSLTEDILHSTPLTSAGRIIIEETIKADLTFMNPFAKVTVITQIIDTDKLKINIRIQEPDNLQAKEFIFIWDAVKLEATDPEVFTIPSLPPTPPDGGLQYSLQFSL